MNFLNYIVPKYTSFQIENHFDYSCSKMRSIFLRKCIELYLELFRGASKLKRKKVRGQRFNWSVELKSRKQTLQLDVTKSIRLDLVRA